MRIRTLTGLTTHRKETTLLALLIGLASGCTGGTGIDATLESELRATSGRPGLRSTRIEDEPQAGAPAPEPVEESAEKEARSPGGDLDDDPRAARDQASSNPESGSEGGDDTAQPDPPPVQPAPVISDDSVRCGDGVLDDDELCDVTIPEGTLGSCRLRCEPTDACPAPVLVPRTCWTQCSC